MSPYRFTSLIAPVFFMAFLPMLAAWPWRFDLVSPGASGMVMPFLTLFLIIFCALRYPGLLISPLVFASGLACDLFTQTPLGFWALLFLLAFVGTLLTHKLAAWLAGIPYDHPDPSPVHNRWLNWLAFCILVIASIAGVWLLASLFQFTWIDPQRPVEAGVMGLIALPIPVLFLIGIERLMIIKPRVSRKIRPGSNRKIDFG